MCSLRSRGKQRREEAEACGDNESDGGSISLPNRQSWLEASIKQKNNSGLIWSKLALAISQSFWCLESRVLECRLTSTTRNSITSVYVHTFSSRWSGWGFHTGTHNIHLLNGKSCQPDLSGAIIVLTRTNRAHGSTSLVAWFQAW